MSGRNFAVEPDRWALGRRPRFRLSGNRILPGPLKSLSRQRRVPAWMAGLGLIGITGLSLATALAVAPHLRGPAPEAAPAVATAAEPHEAAPAPRVVGAAPTAIEAVPVALAPVPEVPAPEQPPLRRAAEEPAAAPVPAQRAAAPALDLGALPVLELDAAAFDHPAAHEPAPRPVGRAPSRNAAPRLAGQP